MSGASATDYEAFALAKENDGDRTTAELPYPFTRLSSTVRNASRSEARNTMHKVEPFPKLPFDLIPRDNHEPPQMCFGWRYSLKLEEYILKLAKELKTISYGPDFATVDDDDIPDEELYCDNETCSVFGGRPVRRSICVAESVDATLVEIRTRAVKAANVASSLVPDLLHQAYSLSIPRMLLVICDNYILEDIPPQFVSKTLEFFSEFGLAPQWHLGIEWDKYMVWGAEPWTAAASQ